jgi:glycosyltransferase involved in cell wall biosynthesis
MRVPFEVLHFDSARELARAGQLRILLPMKVLLVSHNYPPAHRGGTELYTEQLARGLAARGHSVVVFTADKDIARPHLSLWRREHEGIAVHELVNNLQYEAFGETWDLPAIDALFDGVLELEAPDLVHFQHLLYLSVGCVEAAARRRLPVAFTLHDYWLECPRFGQRVHADGTICHTIDEQRCSQCLGNFRYRNSALEQRVAGWIATLRDKSGLDLSPVARRAGDWLRSREGAGDGPHLALEDVRLRNRELRLRLGRSVDRFLSPSAFLRAQLVEWGLDPARVEHLRTGTDLELFAGGAREPRRARLRIGFIGSLIPVKGAHVLLEAFGSLDEGSRARAGLEVFGPRFHDADYQAELERLARAAGASLAGPLERGEVARALRRLDLLVVPSLWFENQPLILLEALAARTPLLVSDLGGLAELVEPGLSGWRFPVGDALSLAERLRDLIADPAPLDALYATPIALPTLSDQLDGVERIYCELAAEAARP